MALTITNRELLRNYKSLKARLVKGHIQQILIKERDGTVYEFSIKEKAQTPFERLAEHVRKHPIKGIKRPEEDLFDERK